MIQYPAIQIALEEIADELQAEQKSLVNKGGKLQAYKTGNLYRTIEVSVKPMKDVVSLITTVPYYGLYVNYGTSDSEGNILMKARPFIETSIETVMRQSGYEKLSKAGITEVQVMVDGQLKEQKIKS